MSMGAPRSPLRNSYWVLPGKVLAGEHPGGATVEATRERLKRLMDAGVECFIDLTEPGELKPYDRGQLAASSLTVDDDDPVVDEGAPWAHLLIDPKSAAAASGSVAPAQRSAGPTQQAAKGSRANTPPGAALPVAAPPTSRRGTSP